MVACYSVKHKKFRTSLSVLRPLPNDIVMLPIPVAGGNGLHNFIFSYHAQAKKCGVNALAKFRIVQPALKNYCSDIATIVITHVTHL